MLPALRSLVSASRSVCRIPSLATRGAGALGAVLLLAAGAMAQGTPAEQAQFTSLLNNLAVTHKPPVGGAGDHYSFSNGWAVNPLAATAQAKTFADNVSGFPGSPFSAKNIVVPIPVGPAGRNAEVVISSIGNAGGGKAASGKNAIAKGTASTPIVFAFASPGQGFPGVGPGAFNANGRAGGDGGGAGVNVSAGGIGVAIGGDGGRGENGGTPATNQPGKDGGAGGDGGDAKGLPNGGAGVRFMVCVGGRGAPGGDGSGNGVGGKGGPGGTAGRADARLGRATQATIRLNPASGAFDFTDARAFVLRSGSGGNGGAAFTTGGAAGDGGGQRPCVAFAFIADAQVLEKTGTGGTGGDGLNVPSTAGKGGDTAATAGIAVAAGGAGTLGFPAPIGNRSSFANAKAGDQGDGGKGGDAMPMGANGGDSGDGGNATITKRSTIPGCQPGQTGSGGPPGQPGGFPGGSGRPGICTIR